MRPIFHPYLVNDPFDDPCPYINFIQEKQAIAFDMGDLSPLSAGALLKISHVFISHTHMDHFVGFDRLLRLVLGRNKTIHVFGPENFLNNIEGKLAAYTWNLAANYQESLTLRATEIRARRLVTREYRCREQFQQLAPEDTGHFSGQLLEEPGFTV